MTANTSDEALERLNYFNGQRLAATDLRAEQSHHLGMRRVLNRSLYSAGIVTGLEVEPDNADKHRVIVRDGLAFDHLGREIFIPIDVSVHVMGVPSSAPGVVFGNLLVVSYREMRKFPSQNSCVIGAAYKPCGADLAWGAPTRVVADAVFEFLDSWPAADSGKIVLAQIELSKSCEVVRAASGVRKYAVPVKAGKTRSLSIVGEHDIAPGNAKLLHFHIADGLPDRAQLYLMGGEFSSLWYSELAKHGHTLNLVVKGDDATGKGWVVDFDHDHQLDGEMALDGAHRHAFWVEETGGANEGGFRMAENAWTETNSAQIGTSSVSPLELSKEHSHGLEDVTVGDANPTTYTITPDFTGSNVEDTGMGPGLRMGAAGLRAGRAYTYFEEMEVSLDGVEVTDKILLQIPDFAQLGVGTSVTPASELFVTEGTPAIDLLLLDVVLMPGAHTLKFRVPTDKGGGKLYFSLYLD